MTWRLAKIALFIILTVYLTSSIFKIKAALVGDGAEYMLMTESFYRHGTPELRLGDLQVFKSYYIEYNAWEGGVKDWVEFQMGFVQQENTPGKIAWGTGISLDNKKYCQHFWLYSLLNVPARAAMDLIQNDPLKSFHLTNAIIVLLVVFYLFFISSISEVKKLILATLFLFSSVFWYIIWTHSEVFVAACVFLAVICFYERKYYSGILLAALATTHNPPIVLLIGFIALKCLIERGFSIKNIGFIFLSAIVCALPTLFYYYHFHVPNLIIEAGFLDLKYYTWTRFFGFFFDLNQGMVLSIPIVLPLFLVLYLIKLLKGPREFDLFVLPLIVGMTLLSMSMSNWNMGEAVVIRYAVWISMPVIVYTVINTSLEMRFQKLVLFAAIIVQPVLILLFGGLEVPAWKYVNHNPIAAWVLSNHPSWYNPDPQIFGERTLQMENLVYEDSPVLYRSKNGEITKLMVHRQKVNALTSDLVDADDTVGLTFINDWAYINKK